MKRTCILSVVVLFLLPAGLVAQKKRPLSDKDKQAIVDIFKQLRAPYCLEFNGSEYYGRKDLVSPDMFTSFHNKSGQAAGYFYRFHPEVRMWYIIQNGAGTPQTEEDVFGKTNAAKLESILKKYD
jgi:hypothetical protein